MRLMISASFGLAVTASALLFAAPVSAADSQALSRAVTTSAAEVGYTPRCFKWSRYCRARHMDSRFRFKTCMAYHGCRFINN